MVSIFSNVSIAPILFFLAVPLTILHALTQTTGAGLPTDQSFNMGVGTVAVGLLGTCLSWTLYPHFGRRTIFNYGLALSFILQLILDILDCVPGKTAHTGVIWAQAAMVIIWNFFYNLTIGPFSSSILCEISAVHVREKTIAFGTAVRAVLGIGMTVAMPYMINPDQANLEGKIGFFFGCLSGLSFIWAYFRVPETVSVCVMWLDTR